MTAFRHRRLAVQLGLTVALGLLVTGAAILFVARSVVLHTQQSEAATHAQLVSREGWSLKQFNDWMLDFGALPWSWIWQSRLRP